MHPDVVTVLALQEQDVALSELQARIDEFHPRIRELDKSMQAAVAEVAKARLALESAEKHERELQSRFEEQKRLHERNMAQLESVSKAREASAAMTQAEISRRFLHDTENEVQLAVAAVVEARARLRDNEAQLEELQSSQSEARSAIQTQIDELQREMAGVRQRRDDSARDVRPPLLQKYERIRGNRRVRAMYAMQGVSCGNCDTAVPIQRRNVMSSTGVIEVCEACGVLLYASE